MGLIIEIGEWVLDEACSRISELNANGFSDLKVSVNVAPQQFESPDFRDTIASALIKSRLNPANLILEITETTLMGEVEQITDVMYQIRKLGVSFSLDDFGTGYSSLNYLKRYPIAELKIDRSFLMEIASKNQDRAIVMAIITLAHSLQQKVVAEGVEDLTQLKFLGQSGWDIIQGYYFSKPLGLGHLRDYLKQYPQVAAG